MMILHVSAVSISPKLGFRLQSFFIVVYYNIGNVEY